MNMVFFPFSDFWWFYLAFTGVILVLLALDLGVLHKNSKELSVKEAGLWTIFWISLALGFNYLLYKYSYWHFSTHPSFELIPGFRPDLQAKQIAMEFLTGLVVEKTLAIDNIFVFTVVFSYFAIPRHLQYRVLFWGILGALLFRALFIALGSYLMHLEWIIWVFGGLLIATGLKMFFVKDGQKDLSQNLIVRFLKKIFPVHTELVGEKFFIRKNGILYVTPLFLALAFLELSDVIFAVDSVPAIFAITKEPLIVFTSNVFAILGLRAMYFMLSGAVEKFTYIKYGLALVLIFVGLKMVYLNQAFGGKFPVTWSLGIIGSVITLSILPSLLFTGKKRSS